MNNEVSKEEVERLLGTKGGAMQFTDDGSKLSSKVRLSQKRRLSMPTGTS